MIDVRTDKRWIAGHCAQTDVVVVTIDGVEFTTTVKDQQAAIALALRISLAVQTQPRVSVAEHSQGHCSFDYAGATYSVCSVCMGTGEVVTNVSRYGAPARCSACNGTGSVRA